MLELIFQGFAEWAYELVLECWEYFSTALLDIMSMDYAYMKSHVPVMDDIIQVLMAVGWALLIGNLVFQALKSMMSGLGFEGEDPKLLFTRSFVFSFLLLASPQICEIGLSITARIIDLLQVPTAVHVTLVDKSVFGTLTASWLLAILRLAPNRKTSCQYGRCSTQTTFAAVSLLRSIYSRILRSSSVNLK